MEEGIQADEILYSPLVRAADTARHITEITGIPARVEPRLIDQNFEKWESTARFCDMILNDEKIAIIGMI